MEEAIKALQGGSRHMNLVAYDRGDSGGELFSHEVATKRDVPASEDALGIHREAAAHEYAVGEEGCVAVAQHVRLSTQLATLTLHGNSVSDPDVPGPKAIAEKGVLAMCDALHQNDSVQEMCVMSLRLLPTMCDALATMLKKHPALRSLSLINNDLPIPQTNVIATALCHSNVRSLTLTRNDLSGAGTELLCEGILASRLEELELEEAGIPHQGGQALALLVAKNKSIRKLTLCRNALADAGAIALAKGLRENKNLTHLDLALNNISDVGAVELGAALQRQGALEFLSLRSNSISDVGAAALAKSLEADGSKLATLVLDLNFIREEGMEALCSSVRVSPSLILLEARGNPCFLDSSLEGWDKAREAMDARYAKKIAAAAAKREREERERGL